MLITPERKVPQKSDASPNDHKSKGYPSKTSEAAFTMQKADKGDKAPCAAAFEIDFQKSDFPALVITHFCLTVFGKMIYLVHSILCLPWEPSNTLHILLKIILRILGYLPPLYEKKSAK